MNGNVWFQRIALLTVLIVLTLGITGAHAASAPTVTTNAATAITMNTATFNGTVSANGAATAVAIEYGLTSDYGNSYLAAESPLAAGASGAAVSLAIGGLECDTLYHFRVTANNGIGGIIDGADLTFTTAGPCPPGTPTATTNAATNITASSATLNGTVTANGTSTTALFSWGSSGAYTVGQAAAESPLAGSASGAPVTGTVASLACSTPYHFAVSANNGIGGFRFGGDLTFTTLACPGGAPLATTDAATAITQTGATLNGTVSANGATTTVNLEYGLTSAYGTTIAATQSPLAGSASGAAVSLAIGSLSCNTLYYFHVVANNGTGGDIDGGQLTFTTSPCAPGAPSATTTAATAITQTGATLNGTVTANGATTTVTFGYGLTAAYGSSVAATQSPLAFGASGFAVSVAIGSLSCNTLYHFHVIANNGIGGNVDGGDLTFTTSPCAAGAPSATTTAATTITQTGATLNGTVTANGAVTTVTFGYGLTAGYGSSVAATQSPLAGSASGAAVSVVIGSLSCNTLYHFHVVANNGIGGNVDGGDLTFTTAACTASNVALGSGVNPSNFGQSVTFTATVTGGSTPTGSMSFYDGATLLGTVTLDGAGQATLSTAALAAGSHNITAQYSGDATHATSTSTLLVQVVSAVATGATAIPTLSGTALWLLGVLIVGLGFGTLRRRNGRTAGG